MRLFAAVVPEAALREEVAALVASAGARVHTRWTPAENLHLTLAFLGEVDAVRLPEVAAAAQSAAGGAHRFELVLQGLGAFDSLQRARVLFLQAVQGAAPLAAVAAAFVDALPRQLRPQDRRRFSAHLTLARPRTPPAAAELAPLVEALRGRAFHVPVEAISIMESRLSPLGASYQERARSPLPE